MNRRRDPKQRLSRPGVPGEIGDPIAVGDAAAMVSAELGLAEPRVFARLVAAWNEIVGPTLGAHSRVRTLRDGVLEIAVDSPAWATEFRYLADDLVERASEVVGPGVVTAVRASVDAPPGSRRSGREGHP
jgi:predicted nucleic acid-binding Zn ribbon protein